MFVKINEIVTATLHLKDEDGRPIETDYPYVVIRNKQGQYYNGIAWSSSECRLYMTHVHNGVYSYEYNADTVGEIYIVCKSDTYEEMSELYINVFDGSTSKVPFEVGSMYTVRHINSDAKKVEVQINRGLDDSYFNGSLFQPEKAKCQMTNLGDGIFTLSFTPDMISDYTIIVSADDGSENIVILDVLEHSDNIPPSIVTHKSITSADGTDARCVDDNFNPLSDVVITAYSLPKKEVKGKATSDKMGQWSLTLKPGLYFFTFDREGYMSVGLERRIV